MRRTIVGQNLFFFVCILCGLLFGCSAISQDSGKMKGFCLEAPPIKVSIDKMKEIAATGTEWVAMIPYGYTMPGESEIRYNSSRQWWGERHEGAAEMIVMAKETGLKVMLKPQVWIPRMWVGDFYPDNMEKWEESMTNFTLHFARLADSLDVELFCLATEYKKLTIENPDYFKELIREIRAVYKGKLTYAANWDEYDQVTFWADLDYIGVNAYFPLSENEQPILEELKASWTSISSDLASMSSSVQKPIIFTEFGYRSIANNTERPWEHGGADYEAVSQSKAFKALFSTVWNEPWMAGGFIWKWRFFEDAGGHGDPSFTPQGKPAMKVIEEVYSREL
ncbi:MAG: glycoside hydrolase [Flavobacteriales bacterium]|nr:glycoside hydrolase [Flavobacteriales bacterium]